MIYCARFSFKERKVSQMDANFSRLARICAGAYAVLGAAALLQARADIAIWTNVTTSATQWGIPGNWTDADGNIPEVAPTNGMHDIKVPALYTDGRRRTIYTGSLSGTDYNTYLDYPAVNPSILSIGPTGGVWDTWRWTVQNATYAQYKCPGFKRWFTIADGSGFDGYWMAGDAKAVFRLDASAGGTPYMSSLGALNRPYVWVSAEGSATGEIGALHQAGTVSKTGDGELRVGATLGGETRFTVEAGTLTLEGRSDSETESLLKMAALRLDATREDTFTTYTKTTDGVEYTIVTNWYDANGNGICGYQETKQTNPGGAWGGQYYFPESHGAFKSPVKSPTGLPLVDFGSHASDEGRFGPSNCWLRLSKQIVNPRSVFYAVQTPGGANGRTILGTAGDSNFAFLTERGDTKLFCIYGAGLIGRNGDIMINAMPVSYDETASYVKTTLTNLNVISVAVQPGATIGTIAADRHYTSRSGGSRLGEVLIFTNELTRAQRVRVAQYLVRRWMTGDDAEPDANAVVVNGASAAIGVPEGRTARVGAVTALSGAFTKKGGGTLAIGSVTPASAKISVEGGSVAFSGAPAIDDTAPAADPYIWLDANDVDGDKMTKVSFDGDDRTFVTEWKDHRDGVDLTAIAISNTLPRIPWAVADIGNGRGPGVSLGSMDSQSFFALPTWGADGSYGSGSTVENDTYAGFIVFRVNDTSRNSINLFGSSNMCMMRSGNTLLQTGYCDLHAPSAFWSINGFPADPFANYSSYLTQTQDVVLVAFRSPVPLTVNAIAKDRKGQKQDASAGFITVGEFITYHRALTGEEFRNTEAYLMRKWLGKAHPATEFAMSAMTFGGSADAVIDSDISFSVENVSGGSGALVKRGSGSVSANIAPVDSIAVEEGALQADISLDSRAIFHFDASREDSFTTYDDGGSTFVTRWDDLSTNGLYGCSFRSSYYYRNSYLGFVMTNPTLETVTMPDGVGRKVVNFGGYRNTATKQETGTNSASIYFSRTADGTTQATPQTRVREIYVVQKYNTYGSSDKYAHFIGNLHGGAPKANAGSTIYMRGGSGMFSATYTSAAVQNGYIAIDRTPKAVTATLPSGWHLLSVGATDFTKVDSIMQDRDCNAGGGCVAEMIAFDFALTAAERADLERRLMRKWGIGSESIPTQSVSSVTVAADSSLSLVNSAISTATLGGGGNLTVESVELTDGGALVFGYRAADDVDHLTVEGPLSLAGATAVRVAVAEGATVAAGEWPLLSATGGISGLNLSALALDIDLSAKWVAALSVRNGALWLKLAPKGTVVVLR